jgi:hypothetical protein
MQYTSWIVIHYNDTVIGFVLDQSIAIFFIQDKP